MNEHKNPAVILAVILALLLIGSIGYFGYTTLQEIQSAKEETAKLQEKAQEEEKQMNDTLSNLKDENETLTKIQEVERSLEDSQQDSPDQTHSPDTEGAGDTGNNSNETDPSVSSDTKDSASTQPAPSPPADNGYMVAIDPGHQGEWIDMSALEPDGPGSSQMKARCTTGTTGSYTGVPEYELNLTISLQLEQELKDRGYKVFLTRTDNDADISNMERAQKASASGAQIYVRIHGNGEESHTASGALTMCPSQSNPYVSHLFQESYRLSQNILDAYCQSTGFSSQGVQYYDNMSGINWSEIPVTILEMGFMTNENDDRKMSDASFQELMVTGIADGIDAYFGL